MAVSLKLFDVMNRNRGRSMTLLQRYQSTVSVDNLSIDEYSAAKSYSEIPTPKCLPLIGNMFYFGKMDHMVNSIDFHKKLGEENGPIYKMTGPTMDIVFIRDPNDSQTLLSKDGKFPMISTFEIFERIRKQDLGDVYPSAGLLSSGEDWYQARTLVQQDMMRPKSALFYIDELSELADEFILKLESNLDQNRKVEDISGICYEFALDAIGSMFIGTKLQVLQGSEYGKQMIDKVTRFFTSSIVAQGIPAKIAPYVPAYKECVQICKDIYVMSKEKIDAAVENHKVDGSLEGTILLKMIERCGPDSPIPVIMANDALLAGIDTTGNTAAFLLYHLAINPDKQEKLYQEIVQVVGSDGKMTEEALAEMRYLKACQQESARIAPIAQGTIRNAGQDMVLSGYQIPKGTPVMRVGVMMSLDEKYFDNPNTFMPERWVRGCPQHQKPRNAHANLPFGHGPRACVGQRFAKLELYMLVFKLVQKYKFSYDGPPIGINYYGLGSPDGPLNFKFEKRV